MTAIVFVLAAGLGALGRLGINRVGIGWKGTLAANVVGAFALGVVIGTDASESVVTVVGTGLLGSFTTFSTFALEASDGPVRQRLVVVAATLILGLGAGAVGVAVG